MKYMVYSHTITVIIIITYLNIYKIMMSEMALLFSWNQGWYYFSISMCWLMEESWNCNPIRELMYEPQGRFSFFSLFTTSPTVVWKKNGGHCVLLFSTQPDLEMVIYCKGLYSWSLELCYKQRNSVLRGILFHRPVGLLRRYKTCLTYKWLENERSICKMETQSSQRILS